MYSSHLIAFYSCPYFVRSRMLRHGRTHSDVALDKFFLKQSRKGRKRKKENGPVVDRVTPFRLDRGFMSGYDRRRGRYGQ